MERLGKVVRGGVSPQIKKHRSNVYPGRSNVYPIIQGNLSGNSTDRDVHCERTGEMEAQKYLRESYYHCIECSVANSLAVLIRK